MSQHKDKDKEPPNTSWAALAVLQREGKRVLTRTEVHPLCVNDRTQLLVSIACTFLLDVSLIVENKK